MAIHFREFAGTYMEHCHNTQHEDSSMLLRWDIEHPGQFELMPTPLPSWDGVEYVATAALPTFRTGNTGNGGGDDDGDDNGGDDGSGGGDDGGGDDGGTQPANKLPIAGNDSASTTPGVAVTLNVLANDTDPDNNVPLTVVGLNQPDSGKGVVSTDGTRIVYMPPATVAEAFTASFAYEVRDALGGVSATPGTVTVAVAASPQTPVNEDLQVTSATVTVRSGGRYTWDLSGTTSKFTGNTITVTAATTGGPLSLGTATLSATATGARWRVSISTTGNGPATPATITVKSSGGQTVTAPVSVR
ncbi:Bacterial Ig domain protein [compost metagenome]